MCAVGARYELGRSFLYLKYVLRCKKTITFILYSEKDPELSLPSLPFPFPFFSFPFLAFLQQASSLLPPPPTFLRRKFAILPCSRCHE